MDVKKFQDSRNKELSDFKKQYQFLKTEYSTTLSAAISEPDPNQQLILIQRVQQINSQLANELHGIINILNKGSNNFQSKQLDELTNDLIKYQKEYAEIEKSKDKVDTLKLVYKTTNDKLDNASFMYYLYVVLLVGLSLYVSYLVLITGWSQSMSKLFSTKPSAPPW
jgi:hypothetical protein